MNTRYHTPLPIACVFFIASICCQAQTAQQEPAPKRPTIDVLCMEDPNDEVLGPVTKAYPLSDLQNCVQFIFKQKLNEVGKSGCVEHEGDKTLVTVPASGQHKVVLGKPGTAKHIEFTFANGRVQEIYNGKTKHSAKYYRGPFGNLAGVSHNWQSGWTEFSREDSVDTRGVIVRGTMRSATKIHLGPVIIWPAIALGAAAVFLSYRTLKSKFRHNPPAPSIPSS